MSGLRILSVTPLDHVTPCGPPSLHPLTDTTEQYCLHHPCFLAPESTVLVLPLSPPWQEHLLPISITFNIPIKDDPCSTSELIFFHIHFWSVLETGRFHVLNIRFFLSLLISKEW